MSCPSWIGCPPNKVNHFLVYPLFGPAGKVDMLVGGASVFRMPPRKENPVAAHACGPGPVTKRDKKGDKKLDHLAGKQRREAPPTNETALEGGDAVSASPPTHHHHPEADPVAEHVREAQWRHWLGNADRWVAAGGVIS